MSDGRERCDDGLWPGHQHVSRRGFLQGAGVLSLAALAPTSVFSAVAGATVEPRGPLVGALFNPYHRARDWSSLAWKGPEGMPLLGSYSSAMEGTAATQVIWARQMGIGFFLASYCPGRDHAGLDALFAAAATSDYSVGLCVDLQHGVSESHRHFWRARLTGALEEISSRYLSHPAYLRTGTGRPVLGVAGLDDGNQLEAVLAATGRRQAWGPVLRLPAGWQNTVGAERDPVLAGAVENDGLYLGFSAQPAKRPAWRRIPVHSRPATAALASPVRNEAGGIELPSVPTLRGAEVATLLILDSFNNWGVSVPLEPGTISRTTYVETVAAWSRSRQA